MLARHRSLAHHTSDSNDETPTPTPTTLYLDPLNCNPLEVAPLLRGLLLSSGFRTVMVAKGLGIPEVVGMLRFVPDVWYIVALVVVRRPSTPLSLAKPTEPVIAPVTVVSYLGQI